MHSWKKGSQISIFVYPCFWHFAVPVVNWLRSKSRKKLTTEQPRPLLFPRHVQFDFRKKTRRPALLMCAFRDHDRRHSPNSLRALLFFCSHRTRPLAQWWMPSASHSSSSRRRRRRWRRWERISRHASTPAATRGCRTASQVSFRRRFPRLPSGRAAAAARGLRAAVAAVPPMLRAAEAAERSNPWMRISPARWRLL